MANRHLLAVNKLDDFKSWLIQNNWQIEDVKGQYEVLRARKSTEHLPLIVYKKDKDGLVHLSVSDWNAKYVQQFIDAMKNENNIVQNIAEPQAKIEAQKKHIKELQKVIEKYKRDNAFLKDQLNNNLDKYSKLRIAQEEALSLIDDVEDLKNELKAVQNGEVKPIERNSNTNIK